MSFSKEHFQSIFEEKEDQELLNVLDLKEEYQPEAVEVATEFLHSRGWSDERIEEALFSRSQEREKEAALAAKKKEVDHAHRFQQKLDTLDAPDEEIQVGLSPRTFYCILGLSAIWWMLCCYWMYMSFIQIEIFPFSEWSVEGKTNILMVLGIPVASILFWKKNRISWFIFASYFFLKTLASVFSIGLSIRYLILDFLSINPQFLINIFIYNGIPIATTILLVSGRTRQFFSIKNSHLIIPIAIALGLTGLQLFQSFSTSGYSDFQF